MLSETEVPSAYRYLICEYFFDRYWLQKIKGQVIAFMKERNKDAIYKSFIEWENTANEIAVFTSYAYADLDIPKHFDTVFDISDPDNYDKVDYELILPILNGYAPFNGISHGHKHVCVLKFEKSIPSIFDLLIPYQQDWPKHQISLGFCLNDDFLSIKQRLLSPKEYD